MTVRTRTTGTLALLFAAQTLALGLVTPAVAAGDHAKGGVCHRATQYLPRTPDAVEGWLRDCRSR